MYLPYQGLYLVFIHILSSSEFTIGSGCSLMTVGSLVLFLPGSPQGSEVHIWRDGIADDCDILVCQFGKKVLHFSLVWKTHAGDQAQGRWEAQTYPSHS